MTSTSHAPTAATTTSPYTEGLLAVALVVAGAVHVPVIAPHLEEAPYMGRLFVGLTVACLALSVGVLVLDGPALPAVAVVVCGLAVLGYVATRSVAFPQLADDVGDWADPLGVVAVVSELVVVAAGIRAVRRAR